MDCDDIPPIHPNEDRAWRTDFVACSKTLEDLQQLRQKCKTVITAITRREKAITIHSNELQEHRRLLESRVQKLDAALAPHRRLPSEVLSYIFELVRGNEIHVPPQASWPRSHRLFLSQPYTEFYPEQVCVLWRNVAFLTPALSRKVVVDYSNMTHRSYNSSTEGEDATAHRFVTIAKSAIRRNPQFLEVEFGSANDAPGFGTEFELLRELITPIPANLKSLKIGNRNVAQDFLDNLVRFLPSLPQINHIHLTFNLGQGHFFPLFSEPLKSLRTIKVAASNSDFPDFFSEDGLCQLLACCPQLRECDICIGCRTHLPRTQNHHSGSNTTHNLLEILKIKHSPCRHIEEPCNPMSLFQHLTLPSLSSLEIVTADSFSDNTQSLKNFLVRSRCGLKQLKIRSPMMENGLEPDWENFLPHLPELSELSVLDLIGPHILHKIASAEYLPQLKRLSCEVYSIDDNCAVVETAVRSRYKDSEGNPYYPVRFSPLHSSW